MIKIGEETINTTTISLSFSYDESLAKIVKAILNLIRDHFIPNKIIEQTDNYIVCQFMKNKEFIDNVPIFDITFNFKNRPLIEYINLRKTKISKTTVGLYINTKPDFSNHHLYNLMNSPVLVQKRLRNWCDIIYKFNIYELKQNQELANRIAEYVDCIDKNRDILNTLKGLSLNQYRNEISLYKFYKLCQYKYIFYMSSGETRSRLFNLCNALLKMKCDSIEFKQLLTVYRATQSVTLYLAGFPICIFSESTKNFIEEDPGFNVVASLLENNNLFPEFEKCVFKNVIENF